MLSLAPCRFLRGRVPSQAMTRSSSQRGNGHCAQDSHHHHAVDTLLSSVAPPPLRRLDQTKHHLAPAWDADRPFQEQVRAGGRKRPVASTPDHPASTGETACLYQDRPDAPGPADKHGADLETGVVHRSARDEARAVIARASNSFGSTSRGLLLPNQGSPRKPSP
jgi:hypothetical protein